MKKRKLLLKFVVVCTLMITSVVLKAQVWVPLDFQPTSKPFASYSDDQYYYACQNMGYNKYGRVLRVMKWDGAVWQATKIMTLDSNAIVTSIAVYNRNLFLAGEFTSPFNKSIRNILTYSNGVWKAVSGGALFSNSKRTKIYDMLSTSEGLIVGGFFDSINKVKCNNIAKYDGKSFSVFTANGTNGTVRKLFAYSSRIYVLGSFSKIGSVTSKGVSYVFKGTWSEIGNLKLLNPIDMAFYLGKEFVAVKEGVKYGFYQKNESHIWESKLNGLAEVSRVTDIIQYNGKIYAAGKFHLTSKDSASIVVWDGKIWNKAEADVYLGEKFEIFKKGLLVYGNLLRLQNTYRPVYTAKLELNKVRIQGITFWDKNNNCVYEKGVDRILPKEVIHVSPGNRYIYSNGLGYFSGLFNKNVEYTFTIKKRKYWESSTCSKDVIKVKTLTNDLYNVSFPLRIKDKVNDIKVNIVSGAGWKATKGEREFYRISYKNLGSEVQKGTISLDFDERLKDVEAYPAPKTFNPGKLVWEFDQLAPDDEGYIGFYANVDESKIDENEKLNFSVGGFIAGDVDDKDNYDSLQQEVSTERQAVIFKSIYPEPNEGDTIAQLPQDLEAVKFLIHFENENTAPVATVHVIDTIDLNLNLAHVKELGASHDYTTTVKNDPINPEKGIIIWTFNNINLEKFDSKGGYENPTFGFISYEIQLKTGNPIGTIISNKARVIYDYSNEFITNTVWGIITDNSVGVNEVFVNDVRVNVYPNPTNDFLSIAIEDNIKGIKLINELGQEIYQNQDLIEGKREHKIDVKQYSAGTYYVVVSSDKGQFINKIVIK